MEKVDERQPFSEIPSPILWDILGRVPIKTCLACKLVCKEWYHIVINTEFSSFRRSCNASRFTLLFRNNLGGGTAFNLVEVEKALNVDDSGICIVGVDDLVRFEPKIDTSAWGWGRWFVRSNSNWVCFLSPRNDYFVCNNLLTGHRVNLQNQSGYVCGCELGFCPASGQFKVLILLWDPTKNIQPAKIQTLGDGEWRSVGNAPNGICRDGCFLNGSSHWHGDSCIWSFHFGKEKFSRIPFLDDVILEAYKKKNKTLSVLDSCLCLSFLSEDVRVEMDIWIMKEYGVKESWVRQFVIVNDAWSPPVAHMAKGKRLATTHDELLIHDLQTRIFESVKFELNGLSGTRVLPVVFDANPPFFFYNSCANNYSWD